MLTKASEMTGEINWPKEVLHAFKKNCDVLVRRVQKDGITTYKFFRLDPAPIAKEIVVPNAIPFDENEGM